MHPVRKKRKEAKAVDFPWIPCIMKGLHKHDRGAAAKSSSHQSRRYGGEGKGRPPRFGAAAWRRRAGPSEKIRRTAGEALPGALSWRPHRLPLVGERS